MAKKVLIVDDDPDLLLMVKKQLEFNDLYCACATTVEKGLKILEEDKFDIIILDLGFAQASGMAFLECAKDHVGPGRKVPPVIVLSGINDREVVDHAIELGAVAFIAKPYHVKALVSTVQDYLT